MSGYDGLGSSPLSSYQLLLGSYFASFANMVKKTADCDLKGIVPTTEEKAKALAKRAHMDNKAKRAVKASVRSFWKKNIDANTGAISEVPDEIIDKWLVHLARCEDAEKKITPTTECSTTCRQR